MWCDFSHNLSDLQKNHKTNHVFWESGVYVWMMQNESKAKQRKPWGRKPLRIHKNCRDALNLHRYWTGILNQADLSLHKIVEPQLTAGKCLRILRDFYTSKFSNPLFIIFTVKNFMSLFKFVLLQFQLSLVVVVITIIVARYEQ